MLFEKKSSHPSRRAGLLIFSVASGSKRVTLDSYTFLSSEYMMGVKRLSTSAPGQHSPSFPLAKGEEPPLQGIHRNIARLLLSVRYPSESVLWDHPETKPKTTNITSYHCVPHISFLTSINDAP